MMQTANMTATAMACTACDVMCQKFGTHRNGLRRFRCPECKKTYTEPHKPLLDGMTLDSDKALLALQLLIEGNSKPLGHTPN